MVLLYVLLGPDLYLHSLLLMCNAWRAWWKWIADVVLTPSIALFLVNWATMAAPDVESFQDLRLNFTIQYNSRLFRPIIICTLQIYWNASAALSFNVLIKQHIIYLRRPDKKVCISWVKYLLTRYNQIQEKYISNMGQGDSY